MSTLDDYLLSVAAARRARGFSRLFESVTTFTLLGFIDAAVGVAIACFAGAMLLGLGLAFLLYFNGIVRKMSPSYHAKCLKVERDVRKVCASLWKPVTVVARVLWELYQCSMAYVAEALVTAPLFIMGHAAQTGENCNGHGYSSFAINDASTSAIVVPDIATIHVFVITFFRVRTAGPALGHILKTWWKKALETAGTTARRSFGAVKRALWRVCRMLLLHVSELRMVDDLSETLTAHGGGSSVTSSALFYYTLLVTVFAFCVVLGRTWSSSKVSVVV